MALKDNWTPQDATMDADPEIPNMIADAVIALEKAGLATSEQLNEAIKTAIYDSWGAEV